MKRKLSRRETIAHLDALIAAQIPDSRADSATFLLRLKTLRGLVASSDRDELSLAAIHSALFDGLKPESRRTTFSTFRKAISTAAETIHHEFSLVQPPVRGKSASQITVHFEGLPLADLRESLTLHATAKLDQMVPSEPRIVPDVIRIFISFANDDATKAAELKKLLESTWGERRSHRISFWIFNEPQNGGILAGENNREEIQRAIASCPLALFLLSPSFSKSTFIREHEMPAYFPNQTGRHPVFVNLRNSKPPASHLSEALLDQFVFSHKEKSYEDMRDKSTREQFAAALNDHIEQLCRKHFGPPREEPEPVKAIPAELRRPKDLLPTTPLDFCEVAARYHRGDRGVDAVNDLLAWAKNPERGHYFALLGETGAGKSTTVLLFARAINREKGQTRAYLFDLRYANYDGLLDRTNKRPTLNQLIEAILRRHDAHDLRPEDYLRAVREENAVLIFDGLDEVFVSLNASEQDSLMHQLLRALPIADARKPGAGKLLFACRTQYFRSNEAERGGLTLHGREGLDFEQGKRASFELARMLPFTEEQIRAYFIANLPAIPFEEIWSLLEKIHELRELATHPYLLDLIRKQLPALNSKVERNESVRAVDLYDGFISDWSHERNRYHNVLQPEDKNELMELLAVHMWRHETKSLPAREMERWLLDTLVLTPRWQVVYVDLLKPQSQESLLSDFRTASFVSRWEGDTFRFAHTSLQEYFLARHLAKSLMSGTRETSSASPEKTWNLPMPSNETFDFLGQILQIAAPREREQALASLAELLSDSAVMPDAKLAALRYHILASCKNLPVPNEPALDGTGLDLEGWELHGSEERPLMFGNCILADSNLLRASFEHIRFQSNTDFRSADLRSTCFYDCPLPDSDFRGSVLDGAYFRECNLLGTNVDGQGKASSVIAHLCPGSPWPKPAPPAYPSATFADGLIGSCTNASISPDGMFIASTSYDSTIRIWNASSGWSIRSLIGHSSVVNSASWSPDGRFVVSASDDHSLRIWEVSTGKSIHTLSGHSQAVKSASWSPDGKLIVSTSEDYSLQIWNADSGNSIRSLTGHCGIVNSASWSPDGRFIVSASDDTSLRIWDASSGELINTISGHTDCITSTEWSPDGKLIVSTSFDETIRIWDPASCTLVRVFHGHADTANHASWSPDSRFIVSASDDYTICIWDSSSGKAIRTFSGHTGYVHSTMWLPDGKIVVSASDDGTIRIWDASTGKLIRSLTGRAGHFTCAALSPDEKFIATASNDNALRIMDTSTGETIRSINGHTDLITFVAWSPDGSQLISASLDKTFRIWNSDSGKVIRILGGHTKRVTSAAWSPDGKHIASISHDKSLRIWESSSGTSIHTFYVKLMTSVAWSSDGRRVMGKEYKGKILCWDLTGNRVPTLPEDSRFFANQSEASAGANIEVTGRTGLCLRKDGHFLREILPLPNGQTIVREPWDEDEARKPYHEIRWKFTRGPKDAWRWCHVVDPETGAIHPPELAAVPGAFSGPEVGPL